MNRADPECINANVPSALRELPQWVCWHEEVRGGKLTKVPYVAGCPRRASSTSAADWRAFDVAMASFIADPALHGIGFVFAPEAPFCGVDLDKCRDPESGALQPWAQAIVQTLASYTEVSPSGTGVKIFLRGNKPGSKCRKAYESGEVELYDRDRFFTVTGLRLDGTPNTVEERQAEIAQLYERVFGKAEEEPPHPASATDVTLSDDEIIRLMSASREKNEKFAALWQGRWNDYFNSPSNADCAVVFKLAYYTKDAAQIDRVFRQSRLFRPKWDELRGEQTYGQMTIAKALAKVTGQYRPRGKAAAHLADRTHGTKGLPRIVIDNIQLEDLTAQALAALQRANEPPVMFVRGCSPSRIIRDEKDCWIIESCERTRIRCRLGQVAVWLSLKKKGEDIMEIDANPPLYLAENILARGIWPFPPLLGIAQAPILRPDGGICVTPGYDPETKLVYAPSDGLIVPVIPPHPTPEEVVHARELLLDVIVDFPFDSAASRANALSLLFSILMRPAITGSFPMLLVDAPVQGTGKTLLVMAIASIAVEAVPVQTAPAGRKDKEEEWRKRISTILLESHQVVLVDNLPENESFDSVSLAAALTSPEWIDRRLGKNESIAVPSRCVWTATGNNLSVTGDMPRRCYTVRLDANNEKPWERGGFRHDDIMAYVKASRGKLLQAAYILIRAWFTAGKPLPSPRVVFGSFQEWADAIGGVFAVTGIDGFLGNLEAIRSVQDDDTTQWKAFFSAWRETIGTQPVIVEDIVKRIIAPESLTEDALPDCLSVPKEKGISSLKRSLGRHLARLTGRIFEGYKLTDAGKHTYYKVRMWKLEPQKTSTENTDHTENITESEMPCGGMEVIGGLFPIVYNTRAPARSRIHTRNNEQGEINLQLPPYLHNDKDDEEVII